MMAMSSDRNNGPATASVMTSTSRSRYQQGTHHNQSMGSDLANQNRFTTGFLAHDHHMMQVAALSPHGMAGSPPGVYSRGKQGGHGHRDQVHIDRLSSSHHRYLHTNSRHTHPDTMTHRHHHPGGRRRRLPDRDNLSSSLRDLEDHDMLIHYNNHRKVGLSVSDHGLFSGDSQRHHQDLNFNNTNSTRSRDPGLYDHDDQEEKDNDLPNHIRTEGLNLSDHGLSVGNHHSNHELDFDNAKSNKRNSNPQSGFLHLKSPEEEGYEGHVSPPESISIHAQGQSISIEGNSVTSNSLEHNETRHQGQESYSHPTDSGNASNNAVLEIPPVENDMLTLDMRSFSKLEDAIVEVRLFLEHVRHLAFERGGSDGINVNEGKPPSSLPVEIITGNENDGVSTYTSS